MENEKKPTKRLTLKEKKNKPLNNELKKRVIDAKGKLPTSGITSLLIFKHPELDTIKKKSLIANVLQLRQTDEDITEKLEALAFTLTENPEI